MDEMKLINKWKNKNNGREGGKEGGKDGRQEEERKKSKEVKDRKDKSFIRLKKKEIITKRKEAENRESQTMSASSSLYLYTLFDHFIINPSISLSCKIIVSLNKHL